MGKLFLLPLVVSALLVTSAAKAGFVMDYSQWRELNTAQKEAYVMGVWDANKLGREDDTKHFPWLIGTSKCGEKLNLTSSMLVDAVNAAYMRNTDRLDNYAAVMVYATIRHMCLKYINVSRKSNGLKPLRPWKNWK